MRLRRATSAVLVGVALAVLSQGCASTPATAAPAAYETPPAPGSVPVGTYGITSTSLVCSFTLSGPYGETGPRVASGLAIVVRCYGPGRTGTIEPALSSVSLFVREGPDDESSPVSVFVADGEFNSCHESGSVVDHSAGQYQMTCVLPGGVDLEWPVAFGPGIDMGSGFNDHYFARVVIGTTGSSDLMSSGEAPAPYQSKWRSIGVWQSTSASLPEWPSWWPDTATALPPDDANVTVNAPDLTCNGLLREDTDGVIRATMVVKVNNPLDPGWSWISDGTPEWAFGWENDFAGETAEWFDVTHSGRKLEDVEVPGDGVPTKGWQVSVRMNRVITGDDHAGETPAYPTGIDPEHEDSGGGGWFIPLGWEWRTVTAPGGGTGIGIVPSPAPVNGYWVPEGVGGGGYLPTAWTTIYGICTFRVDPRQAGSEGGNGGGRATPTPNPNSPPPEVPNEPGEGPPGSGGGGGCDTPDGWNMINPIAWMSSAACVLGPLWDFLENLLEKIGDLIGMIGDIAEWISNLGSWIAEQLTPTEPFGDRLDRIQAEVGDSGPGTVIGVGYGFAVEVAEGMSGLAGPPGPCEGPQWTISNGSAPIVIHPLSSCGHMETVRVFFFNAVSAIVIFQGLRSIMGIVLEPFGMGDPFDGDDD